MPDDFRFSVKVPKRITHDLKLIGFEDALLKFLGECSALGRKLAILLVQLPPKLEFDEPVARSFFANLTRASLAAVACEPRHASWFRPDAEALMEELRVARVAADPVRCDGAGEPGGWRGLSYWRLHGSPVMYRSSYADRIDRYVAALRAEAQAGHDAWCVFDNTASSAATSDALALQSALRD